MHIYSSNRCTLCDCTNIPECKSADPYKFNPSLTFIIKDNLVICSECEASIEDVLSEDNFLEEEEIDEGLGDVRWEDKTGHWHFTRDGVDLLEGKEAVYCESYRNGDVIWKDKNEHWHCIRDGIDLLEGKEAVECFSYDNGDVRWEDKNGHWHTIEYKDT